MCLIIGRQRVFFYIFSRCEELIFRDTNGKSFNWMHFAGALSIIKRSILWVLNHYRKNNSLYLEMSVLNINDIYVYSFSFLFFLCFSFIVRRHAGGLWSDTVLLSFYFQQIFFLARNKCGEMRTRTVLPESCYTLWMTN